VLSKKRVLRIHVTNMDKERVNVTLPLGLAKLARIGPIGAELKRHDIDIDEILDDLEDTPDGKIVEIDDEKSGDHVEIFVESRGTDRELAPSR
jgi:hypothetical protein